MKYSEEELEAERCIDDDYNVINHYYGAKRMHPIFHSIFKMRMVKPLSLNGI